MHDTDAITFRFDNGNRLSVSLYDIVAVEGVRVTA